MNCVVFGGFYMIESISPVLELDRSGKLHSIKFRKLLSRYGQIKEQHIGGQPQEAMLKCSVNISPCKSGVQFQPDMVTGRAEYAAHDDIFSPGKYCAYCVEGGGLLIPFPEHLYEIEISKVSTSVAQEYRLRIEY